MISYAPATPADDATLRALLRNNAMPSWVTMSLEREPSYFAGTDFFGRESTVIARDGTAPVGMYTCTEHRVHMNGFPAALGYLGALRVSPAYRHRLRILRDGYNSIRRFCTIQTPSLWYTAIAAENHSARRLLEANLPGMPRYEFASEMVTMALPQARGVRQSLWRAARPDEMDTVGGLYNRHAREFQFSPALNADIAMATGAAFFVAERNGTPIACMGLWNQQHYKQVVARAYRRPLTMLIPVYNAYASIARKVPLPRVGQPLDQTSLAFFAVDASPVSLVTQLIADALALCPTTVMTLGLHSKHPWLAHLLRTFRPLTYRTAIYAVRFEDGVALDARPAQPEVAIL